MSKLFTLTLILISSTGRQSYEIPEFVYEKCKYADICNRTATLEPLSGLMSCCKSCSCEADCGLTLNCCFDYLDEYNLVERGLVSCINPLAYNTQEGTTLVITTASYYMVTSCCNVTYADHCRWADDHNSSILAPVTDLKTNTTYVNEDCAKCNNVNTFVKWNFFYNDYGVSYASSVWKLEDSNEKKIGSKLFTPPLSIWKSIKECHVATETVTCDDTSPNYDVCQNLRAPYKVYVKNQILVYNNIGCYSCKANVIRYADVCPSGLHLRTHTKEFTVLVDSTLSEAMTAGRSLETIEKYSNQETCPAESIRSQLKERCLHIYCPETMVRTDEGCKHLYLLWYPRMLYMRVKLIPTSATFLPVSTLTSLPEEYLRNVDKWISLPCNKLKPFQYTVHYETSSLQYVKSIVVRLIKPTSGGISPAQVLPILKKCTKRSWVLQMDNISYIFMPEMSRYFNYVQDGRTEIYSTALNKVVKYIQPKIYEKLNTSTNGLVGGGGGGGGYNQYIRKTCFCRQIRLPMDEVEIKVEEVRILSTNKTLGNNYFEINNATRLTAPTGKEGNAKSSVTVCIDDYIKSGTCSENLTNLLFVCVFLVYILFTLLDIILM